MGNKGDGIGLTHDTRACMRNLVVMNRTHTAIGSTGTELDVIDNEVSAYIVVSVDSKTHLGGIRWHDAVSVGQIETGRTRISARQSAVGSNGGPGIAAVAPGLDNEGIPHIYTYSAPVER